MQAKVAGATYLQYTDLVNIRRKAALAPRRHVSSCVHVRPRYRHRAHSKPVL